MSQGAIVNPNRAIPRFRLNNITPFTYRDGLTFLELIEELRQYVVSVIVPEIDEKTAALEEHLEEVKDSLDATLESRHTQMVESLGEYSDIVIESVEEFQRIHDAYMADVNSTLMALNDAALHHLINDETSTTGGALRDIFVQQDRMPLNVKDYGVTGDGSTDDTDAFQVVLNLAEDQDRVVYMPAGDYRFRPDEIVLRQYHRIMGDGLDKTIIRPVGESGVGVGFETVNYNNLTGLYFRDWKEGVKATGHTSKIHQCRFSYNTVGVHFESRCFIFSFFENTVTYNRSIGLLVGHQTYQLIIAQNIIDNNNGLGIGLYGDSTGVVIRNNTIEGNRRSSDDSGLGCGVMIRGYFSRLAIEGNWFEANGATKESSDIFFIGKEEHTEYREISDGFISNVIDPAYQELFDGYATNGEFTIRSNRFYGTDTSIVVSHVNPTSYSIEDNTFFATSNNTRPRHIVLNVPNYALANGVTARQVIDRNHYNNQFHTVDNQYNGTIVYVPEVPTQTFNRAGVLYNGNPLFHQPHISYGETFTDVTKYNSDAQHNSRFRFHDAGHIEAMVDDVTVMEFGLRDFPQPVFRSGVALSLNGVTVQAGGEEPNGKVAAPPGSLYLAWGGAGGATGMWFKQSGTGNTGWVEK